MALCECRKSGPFSGGARTLRAAVRGYCAYAVSKGRTASIDPEAWKIVDGKLYLNYTKGVQKKWEQDVPGNIVKADRNWPELHK